MADSIAGILARFKESLAADKKKTALLGILCLVLLVVLARQFFSGSTVEPAAASASLIVASSPKVAQSGALIRPTVETTRSASPSRAVASASPLDKASLPRAIAPTSEKVVSVEGLPRKLSRNIFDTASWNRFARLAQSDGTGHRGADEEGPPSLLMRIGRKLAMYGRSRREEERKIDEDIAKLRLESTMTGQLPLAHVSGRLVRVGEQIEGFSVVHIRDRQVMLRKSGVTRVLTMP